MTLPDENDVRAKAREICIRFGLSLEREDTIVDTFEPLIDEAFYAGLAYAESNNRKMVNAMAEAAERRSLDAQDEAELESPSFTPEALKELAARGYERVNNPRRPEAQPRSLVDPTVTREQIREAMEKAGEEARRTFRDPTAEDLARPVCGAAPAPRRSDAQRPAYGTCTGCGAVAALKAYSCSEVSMRLCPACDPQPASRLSREIDEEAGDTMAFGTRVDPVLRAWIAGMFDRPEWQAGTVNDRIKLIEELVQRTMRCAPEEAARSSAAPSPAPARHAFRGAFKCEFCNLPKAECEGAK